MSVPHKTSQERTSYGSVEKMSEAQETGTSRKLKPNRFRISSIVIAIVMLMGAFAVLIGPITLNVSATTSGSVYSGSGDWVIANPTIYTGETLTIYGNISIEGSGTLTLINTDVTIDSQVGWVSTRWINVSRLGGSCFLKLQLGSSISTLNHSTYPNVGCVIDNSGYFQADNSTVHAIKFTNAGGSTLNHWSNSTFEHCLIYYPKGLIDNSAFSGIDANLEGVIVCQNNGERIIGCTFTDIIFANKEPQYASVIRHIGAISNLVIDSCDFLDIEYPHIALIATGNVMQNCEITNCYFSGVNATTGGAAGFISTWIYSDAYTTVGNLLSYNEWYHIGNGSTGAKIAGQQGGWTFDHNTFSYIDDSDPDGLTASGIYVYGTNPFVQPVVVSNTTIGRVNGPPADVGGVGAGITAFGSNWRIENTTIDAVTNVSNGLWVAGTGDCGTVRYTEISSVTHASDGIGIYYYDEGSRISESTISGVDNSSCGIRVDVGCNNTVIADNSVTVTLSGDFVGQGGTGAYSVNTGGATWGYGIRFENNSVSGATNYYYPAYNITGTGTHLDTMIVLSEPTTIRWQNANLTIRHTDGQILQLADGPICYNITYHANGTATRAFPRTDTTVRFLNITYTTVTLVTSAEIDVTVYGNYHWLIDGAEATTVTFTLSGLDRTVGYKVYVDGEEIYRQHSGYNSITFTYSGPWSDHEFEVVVWDPYAQWDAVATLMMYAGIAIGFSAIVLQAVLTRRGRG